MRRSDDHVWLRDGNAEPSLTRVPFADAEMKGSWKRSPAESARGAALPDDVAFLAKHAIPERVLRSAALLAACRRTHASHELIAAGFDRMRYWQLLAAELGVRFVDDLSEATFFADPETLTTEAVRAATTVRVLLGRAVTLVVAPRPSEIPKLVLRLAENSRLAERVAIAAPETIRGFLVARRHAVLADHAVNRLSRAMPPLSARQVGLRPEPQGAVTLGAALLGLFLLTPSAGLAVLSAFFTLFFLNCAIWRLAAALSRPQPLRIEPLPSAMLPRYTILVPLYREAEVVGDLLRRIAALDYPASKLQVLLLLEADDLETSMAAAFHAGAPFFEVIIVPSGGPRTKPKALTYALQFARGDLIVVYDAEDRPEPDQLRKAAAAFEARPGLGCVQARLAPDNEAAFLAKMFKLEYAANFEILLPALAAWRAPLPLGGTSNHFPRIVLDKVGGWDPFNVTEDADLGIRMARFGHATATIFSRTYEEAPIRMHQWLPQRRRWIKGWIQTILVCLGRDIPASLRLSLREQLAVHGIMTAGVVGLLLYPISFVAFFATGWALAHGHGPQGAGFKALLALNCGNIVLVLIASAISAWRGLRLVRAWRLAWWIPALPLYWFLMSIAAWQAFYQFFKEPARWEKTEHGVARDRRTPVAGAVLLN